MSAKTPKEVIADLDAGRPLFHQSSENKDWEAIAKEIWDEYDALALYLEDYMNSKNGAQFPFLEKQLPRRFKYFRNYHGETMTPEEYEKRIEGDKARMETLYKTLIKDSINK